MAGIDAFGTKLEIHDGDDPGDFDPVGELVEIGVLDVSVDDLDVTSHDSPDQWREFVGGLKDPGELSGTLRFDPALHGDLLGLLSVTRQMRVVLPPAADDATVTFEGHINGFTVTAPHDDALDADISIKVTSAPVLDIP